jgi:hypothetical protein
MSSCNLTDANIKRKLLNKGLEIARKVNPRFELNRLQEIILVPDLANKFEKEIYQLRSIADRAERRITKELDIPINVFGRVFGARSYSDAAAIEIVITPQIRKAYEAKQELITEEQAVEEIKKANIEQTQLTEEVTKTPPVKPGVLDLFKEKTELASIGTPEQYSQYLDTIFPDSKVKDIVYHGTGKEFDKFKKPSEVGSQNRMIAFADDIEYAKIAGNRRTPLKKVISALVNINKLYPVDKLEAMELDSGIRDEVLNELKKEGVDGFAFESDDDLATKNFNEVLVFEPEQIHILGNKQDIEGFKEFVGKQQTRPTTSTYGPSTAYRPQGFYKGDRALFEQELRDLENAMDEVSDISEATILEDTETKFEPPVITPVQLEFKFSPEQPNQKGNLDDLGFEEVSCNV